MDWILRKSDELEPYLEYFPRNDSYVIRDLYGNYFKIDGEVEVYRKWGDSQIYVGYHGESVVRMEPHIIPCIQHISDYGHSGVCNSLGRIPLHRLVAECWLDGFTPDAVIRRKKADSCYPYAANNLNLDLTHRTAAPLIRNPMDYDCLQGKIELV